MKPQHTPGPWTVHQDSPGTLDVSHATADIRSRICRLHIEALCDEHNAGGGVKANARLIAAAPEMLAALVWISEHDKEFGDVEDFEKQVFEITRKARAAIAKATGGTDQ